MELPVRAVFGQAESSILLRRQRHPWVVHMAPQVTWILMASGSPGPSFFVLGPIGIYIRRGSHSLDAVLSDRRRSEDPAVASAQAVPSRSAE